MKAKISGHGDRTRYCLDGVQVSKEEFDLAVPNAPPAQEGDGMGNRPWAKPILSDALAVHPEQIEEVMERNRERGLEVEYEKEYGRPILKDRDQRRRLMEIEGVHDRDGGYGDG